MKETNEAHLSAESLCTEEKTVYVRSLAARITAIAAYVVAAAGAIYCTVLFIAGSTDASGFGYKLTGSLISVLLFAAFYFFERITKLRIPAFLDIFLRTFIICALVLGRTFDFYGFIPYWDKILHTVSGFLFFFAGMSIGTLFLGEKHGMSEKRYLVVLTVFAFMFALVAGYVWELFEFAGDSLFRMDNQRWAEGLISENPDGTFTVTDKRGTAILDTLGDMYVNFIGAAVCWITCIIAFIRRPEKLRRLVCFVKA